MVTKRMKHTGILLIAFLMVLLTACGSNKSDSNGASKEAAPAPSGSASQAASGQPAEKKLKIGFSVYGLKAEFANLLTNSMKDEADKRGVELVVLDADYTVDKQITQLQNLATQKVDAIIAIPTDAVALNSTVDSIIGKGIPVVAVNAKITTDKITSYVGSPDVLAGEMEAKEMMKVLNGKGNVVILEGPLGGTGQIERKKGIYNVLDKNPDVKVLAIKTANWSRAEGLALMENWLQAFSGKIDAVISQNDEMGLGALNAIKEKNLKIPVVGVDGVKDALIAVQNGDMIATVFQNADAQGRKSLEVAIEAAKGNKVDPVYDIPFELVKKDNVETYLNK